MTEHSTYKGAQEMYEFAQSHDLRIFRGMEVYTELGDMLVFGWSGNIRYYLYPFQQLKQQVEEAGGILIPAHPCRGTEVRHPLRQSLPDDLLASIFAIETRNGACKQKSNEQAQALSEKYGLFGTGGSDAHHVLHLGRCVTVFEDSPENEQELIETLRSGRYRACSLRGDRRPHLAGDELKRRRLLRLRRAFLPDLASSDSGLAVSVIVRCKSYRFWLTRWSVRKAWTPLIAFFQCVSVSYTYDEPGLHLLTFSPRFF